MGAEIPDNLGLGLQAAPVGWLGRMFQAVTGQRDLRVGIEELDRRYDIRAIDEQGATLLLGSRSMSEALIARARGEFPPGFDDARVSGREGGQITEAARRSRALDAKADLAVRLTRARSEHDAAP